MVVPVLPGPRNTGGDDDKVGKISADMQDLLAGPTLVTGMFRA